RPGQDRNRAVVRSGAAAVDDVGRRGRRARSGRERVVAREQTLELLRGGRDVAVEDAGLDRLLHAFDLAVGLLLAEKCRILSDLQLAGVDTGTAFDEARGIGDHLEGGLRLRDALIEASPGVRRKAGA